MIAPPRLDSHILSFIISVFIIFLHVHIGNSHHFFYLSSIYPFSVYGVTLMLNMTVKGNCQYVRF